jgi:pentatricopeptide repeat protein
MTSTKLQKYLSRRSSPPTASELEMAEQVIKAAPRPSVNVVVWNVLLQAFGRARAYAKMFKLFNDVSTLW